MEGTMTLGSLYDSSAAPLLEGDWRPIKGYEGYYSISSDGRTWSHRNCRLLKPAKTRAGYLRVHLSLNGHVSAMSLHRLVAMAFIPNPDNKPTVNHINEVKTDNRVENLEWATMHEQNVHGTRIERVRAHTDFKNRGIDYAAVAAHHDYKNLNRKQMKPVLQYDMDGNFIAKFDGVSEAARSVGVSAGFLCSVLRRNLRSCGGSQWRYFEGNTEAIDPIQPRKHKLNPVVQLDMTGVVIAEFPSVKEAAKETGAHRSSISRCARGRGISAGGYKWRYA